MKILFDSQIFNIQRYGGVSKYYYNLLYELSNYDDLKIFLFQGIYRSKYTWSELDNKIERRIGVYSDSKEASNRLISLINQITFLIYKEAAVRPEITHLTYYPFLLPSKRKSKLVVTLHDLIPERYPEYYSKDSILERRKRALANADLIICISEATRSDYFRLLNGDINKTVVIHHGLPFSSTNFQRNENLSSNLPQKPYILYVGIRESYKNFLPLLSAYASSSKLISDYDILCFGSQPFTREEMQRMNALRISTNIHHIAGTDEALQFYYSNAQALVYPSLCEGFGFPLLEAMQMGCPIAASDCSSIPEIGGDAVVYFTPTEADSIRCALESLLYDESLRSQYIKKGYIQMKKYSWKDTAAKTRDAYIHCIHNLQNK